MTFGIDELQSILGGWPNAEDLPDRVDDGILDRMCQVLRAAASANPVQGWSSDLQPLMRHLLLRETFAAGRGIRMRVPAAGGWPSRESWASHGIDALESGGNTYLLEARAWMPDWLGAEEEGVFSDAFSGEIVRRSMQCKADPFIRDATGFTYYSSPGQREAIRAAFLIPEGETLLVNLPTGSGKSLVGQAPSLVNKEEGSLTIFVVPTVALALDQARAMRNLLRKNDSSYSNWPLAWYGGLSVEDRSEVRRRLRNGSQRILFTSPESLTTSLLRVISDVAAAGILRYFVIDEAHLITQWGDEFRPSFQALAGLRNSLLRLSPRGFRTLLLSATFTSEAVNTLASLFGPPQKVQMVSAVHLRPEPQYWFYKASSELEKQDRVIEALRHAPRPFILYVTKREDAEKWNATLRGRGGLGRVALFHGRTPDNERLRIIEEWSSNRIDGVIATSAFGVGLDKSDVRTVIHATIPETLDRFYQEVGRGGRDGKASVSLLIFDDSDWDLPKRLAKPRLISHLLGFSRWSAMYRSSKDTALDDIRRIDIDAVREGLSRGSEENVNWNMRTLSLMARARLISLDIEVGSEECVEDPGEDASSMLAAMANVRVRIVNEGHLIQDVWESAVSASRNETLEAAERNLKMMQQLLPQTTGFDQTMGKEVGAALVELYQIKSDVWPVHVSHVCGGCPLDRFIQGRFVRYRDPVVVPVSRIREAKLNEWFSKFSWINPAFAYVSYEDGRNANEIFQDLLRFSSWLIQSCGVSELAVEPGSSIEQRVDWQLLYQNVRDRVLLCRDASDFSMEPYSPLNRLTVLERGPSTEELLNLEMLQRPFHIVVLPCSTIDPENNLRRLVDVRQNVLHLEDIMSVICQ